MTLSRHARVLLDTYELLNNCVTFVWFETPAAASVSE